MPHGTHGDAGPDGNTISRIRSQCMTNPDILKYILWNCMTADDTELLIANGFHCVSWGYHDALLAFARKHIDAETWHRYYRDFGSLVGPRGKRGNPWLLGLVGGISSIVVGGDELPYSRIPLHMLDTVDTVHFLGTPSSLLYEPVLLSMVGHMCGKRPGSVRFTLSDFTNPGDTIALYAVHGIPEEIKHSLTGISEAVLCDAYSAPHTIAALGIMPGIEKLCLELTAIPKSGRGVFHHVKWWKRVFRETGVPLDACASVKELVLDGTNGADKYFLRDMCWDWTTQSTNRRLPWGLSVNSITNSTFAPAFPFQNVTRVTFRGPLCREFPNHIFMPLVKEVKFEMRFKSLNDTFQCIGRPILDLCAASFPSAERIILGVAEDVGKIWMDQAMASYNSNTGVANAEVTKHRECFSELLRYYRDTGRGVHIVVDADIGDWIELYPQPELGDAEDMLVFYTNGLTDEMYTDDSSVTSNTFYMESDVYLIKQQKCCLGCTVCVTCRSDDPGVWWNVVCHSCSQNRLYGRVW